MEVVDFRTQTFGEIPTQDNPAYGVSESVLICKAEKDQTGLYVVAKIEENHKDKDEVVNGCCLLKCCLGDEGHCGRTEYEYLHHCEKLNNDGKEQRAKIKLNSSEINCR